MSLIADSAKAVYAPGPSSSPFQPDKAQIIGLFQVVEYVLGTAVNGLVIGNAVVYATRAVLFADLARPANTLGIVYNDSTAAYNGVYVKVGASGTGSWTLTGLVLPSSIAADVADLVAKMTAIYSRVNPEMVASGSVIDDRWNVLGGGSGSVYIPAGLIMPNVVQVTLSPLDAKLTGHRKITVPVTDVLVSVYLDASDSSVKVATFPTIMPNDPSRYFHLVSFYGAQRGISTSGIRIESARSVQCVAVASFRPFLYDLDRQALYVPPIAGFVSGDGAWTLLGSDANKTYREVFVPRLPASTAVQYIWVDVADIIKNGSTSATALHVSQDYNPVTNPLPSGEAYTVLLGTIFNEMFTPAAGVHLPVAHTVPNQCGVGRDDNDSARFKFNSTRAVDLKRSESIALGFTRGYAASAPDGSMYRTFYGDLFDQKLKAGVFYARFYLETDVANSFDEGLAAFTIDESGNPIGATAVNFTLVRKISDYVREYEGWLRITYDVNTTHIGCWVGFDKSTKDVCRMFGLQYAATAENIPYVSKADYPRKRNTLGNRLANLEAVASSGEALFQPVIPDRLYVMDGRPVALYPDQMLDGVSSRGRYRISVWDTPVGGTYREPIAYQRDGGDGILIRPEELRGDNIGVDFIDLLGTSGTRKGRNVAIKKVTLPQLSILNKRVLCIGDSISDWNGSMTRSIQRLRSFGSTISTIGTLTMLEFISGDAALTGEGRGGKEFSDFINMDTDKLTAIDNNPTAVAAYLASDEGDEGRRGKNPFIRASTGGDVSDRIYNGKIFDMRFYLTRFGFADPDAVYIALGTNDISQNSFAVAKAQILAGVRVMALQTRLALPSAKIIFGWHSLGRSPEADVRWRDTHLVMLREIIAYIRSLGDPNIFIMPAYCMVSRDSGFPVSEAVDSAGLITRTRSDYIHYSIQGTDQFGEMGALTLGGILAGV